VHWNYTTVLNLVFLAFGVVLAVDVEDREHDEVGEDEGEDPPKLMPPFQRIAASGTLPIEQTKLRIATAGPTTGPQSFASVGWPSRKSERQKCSGTQAASAPATSRPPAMSIQIAPSP